MHKSTLSEKEIYDWGFRDGKEGHSPMYAGLVSGLKLYVQGYKDGECERKSEQPITEEH